MIFIVLCLSYPPHLPCFLFPSLPSPLPSLLIFVASVEVCVLQEADEKGSDGLLRSVLPWALLHCVSPYLCSGSWRPHAPRRLALCGFHHLSQTQSTCHN